MRPDDRAARISVVGFDAMGAAEFFVLVRREVRDDEVALFAEEKAALALLHHEGVAPARRLAAGWRERFPKPLARLQLQAAELSVAAWAVDVAVLDQWRGHHAMQSIRVHLGDLLALPDE